MRRYSLYIFIFVFFLSIIFIGADKYINKYENHIFEYDDYNTVRKIEERNGYTNVYLKESVMTIWGEAEGIEVGSIMKIKGIKAHSLSIENKSYGNYLMSRGYKYIIKSKDYRVIGRKTTVFSYIQKYRDDLGKRIEYIFRGKSPFIKALIYGERSEIDQNINDILSKTGTAHLIAISGFHIGIIAGFLTLLLKKANASTKYFLSIIFIWSYVIFTGGRASTIRAGGFYTFLILSVIFFQEYDILSSGFIIGSFLLLLNPYIIYDLGFQLSFMAILSIGLYYNPIKGVLEKIKRPVLKKILELGALTISVQILTMPLTYYHFGRVSLISFFSNIISVPLIGILYPLLGFVILFFDIPFIGNIAKELSLAIFDFFMYLNSVFSRSQISYIDFNESSIYITILIYILLIGLYVMYEKYRLKENFNDLQGFTRQP